MTKQQRMTAMSVGELRRALEHVPDDAVILIDVPSGWPWVTALTYHPEGGADVRHVVLSVHEDTSAPPGLDGMKPRPGIH